MKLEDIEKYIETIDIEKLSLEELEHYTNIIIAIENQKLDKQLKQKLNS